MSSSPTSFGTTISSGIQDLSAILSLFGTEECEVHVGSALRGEGRGGFLYAAITPLSIFGSLGPAKAAFTILLVSVPFIGANTLQQMGFGAKGDVMSLTMPVEDGKRYGAESRLLALLNRHYLGPSAQNIHVSRPPTSLRLPVRPWNIKLLAASLLVAGLGVTPYLHFSLLHHTTFPPLAILFPILRVVGGLLCVFAGQLLLQYRIVMILRQRLLFTGISNLLLAEEEVTKIPIQYIQWDDTYASEVCLSSLRNFLRSPGAQKDNKAFINVVARALAMENTDDLPAPIVVKQLESYLTNTWEWVVTLIFLLVGFLTTLIGYVGCFTVVQNTAHPSDTYIWLGAEAMLALVRLVAWALNPAWDDSDGLRFTFRSRSQPLPATKVSGPHPPMAFTLISERRFWETLAAHSGVIDISEVTRIPGFRHWYAWTKIGEDAEILSIILEEEVVGGRTVLCTMNGEQDLEFHHADLSTSTNFLLTADRTGRLKQDHALMKATSSFRMDVFEHYRFILGVKARSPEHFTLQESDGDGVVSPRPESLAIQASWTLSHSVALKSTFIEHENNSEDDKGVTQIQTSVTPNASSVALQPGANHDGISARAAVSHIMAFTTAPPSAVHPPDVEPGDFGDHTIPVAITAWADIEKAVQGTLDGTAPSFSDFDNCVKAVSANSASWDLYSKILVCLSNHTNKICLDLNTETDLDFERAYDTAWQTFSSATAILRRLFKPFNFDQILTERTKEGKARKGDRIEPLHIVAFRRWNTNVLEKLTKQLGAASEVATKNVAIQLSGGTGGRGGVGRIQVGEGYVSSFVRLGGGVGGAGGFAEGSGGVGGDGGWASGYSVHGNVVNNYPAGGLIGDAFWPAGAPESIPMLTVAQFGKKYSVNDGIITLLRDTGFDTTNGLFEATNVDLKDAGLRVGQIVELKRALKEFVRQEGIVTVKGVPGREAET